MSKRGARTKGYFRRTDTGSTLSFQFNPSSIKTSRKALFNDLAGCGSAYPTYQYIGGDGEEITFTLDYFNSTSECSRAVSFLEGLMPPKDTQAIFSPPPVFYFSFGSSFTEKCVLEKLDRSHEDFDSDLNTKGMSVNVTLKVVR